MNTPEDSRANASGTVAQRVLILEDDVDFKQIMSEFLVSHGFEVVAVENGADGVRELLAGNFNIIICDMMMPKLPGDMFYLAVERMRPELCERFIFVTGQEGNPKVNEFIEKVRGTVLLKPFHVDDLLGLIGFVEVSCSLT